MWRWAALMALSLALDTGSVSADAPASSLRPTARAVSDSAAPAPDPAKRPAVRPQSEQQAAAASAPVHAEDGLQQSARPSERPEKVRRLGLFQKRKLRKGAVCGDIDIQGEDVGAIKGARSGCGVQNAVRVRSVSGVRLSTAAVMDCGTAKALKTWVDKGLKPAFKRRERVVEMKVAAHYACRTRNNRPGAKISEHGKGRAIDLSAFTLANGEVVTVLKGWSARSTRKSLQRAYKAACGPFGTTLGPNSDRYHRDHFHFDTARYRSGPYCR